MINRRKFLQITGAGTLSLVSGGLGSLLTIPSASAEGESGSKFNPDFDISLAARPTQIPIFPGSPTRAWSFRGQVLKGDQTNLINLEQSYLGPIIRVKKGQKIRIRFKNDIPDETIVHWHGLRVPEKMDGHPRYAIPQGKTYIYEYEVRNRAGTYWYHPHPHGRTGPQVYGGLAGLFLVSDDEEKLVGLPSGEYEIPLVIQDRTFDSENQLVYLSRGMMDRMIGFLGDRILVNGKPDYTMFVATRVYRLRLLNGSNSRIYKLAWDDGNPLVIIGTDGGLLEKPVHRSYVMLGPGERIDLWADFSKYPLRTEKALLSLPFNAGTMGSGRTGRGMMGGRMMGSGTILPNGAAFTVLNVRVDRKENEPLTLPKRLSKIERYREEDAVNLGNSRIFNLSMRHMAWTINGRTFRMEEVSDDEIVRLNTLEAWEFINQGGGMGMMSMPHPMHLHGVQFQVLQRRGVRHSGYVDNGWKDTVLVMPGERVKLLVRFEDYTGLFLYHCHNLEHEDMGMMRNYLVRKI